MSILNKSDKSLIGSTATDAANQLIELFCEKTKIPNCSISNGVFNIYGGNWIRMYLSTDNLELIAGKNSNLSKATGIKEIQIHNNANISIGDDVTFDKNIVIRSQFDVLLLNSHGTNAPNIYNLNIDCVNFVLGNNRFYVRDSVINASGIYNPYDEGIFVNCEINLKERA